VTRHGTTNPSVRLMGVTLAFALFAVSAVGVFAVANTKHISWLFLYVPTVLIAIALVSLAATENARAWRRCEIALKNISSGATYAEQVAALRRNLGGPMRILGRKWKHIDI
jgi:hypothetical protein